MGLNHPYFTVQSNGKNEFSVDKTQFPAELKANADFISSFLIARKNLEVNLNNFFNNINLNLARAEEVTPSKETYTINKLVDNGFFVKMSLYHAGIINDNENTLNNALSALKKSQKKDRESRINEDLKITLDPRRAIDAAQYAKEFNSRLNSICKSLAENNYLNTADCNSFIGLIEDIIKTTEKTNGSGEEKNKATKIIEKGLLHYHDSISYYFSTVDKTNGEKLKLIDQNAIEEKLGSDRGNSYSELKKLGELLKEAFVLEKQFKEIEKKAEDEKKKQTKKQVNTGPVITINRTPTQSENVNTGAQKPDIKLGERNQFNEILKLKVESNISGEANVVEFVQQNLKQASKRFDKSPWNIVLEEVLFNDKNMSQIKETIIYSIIPDPITAARIKAGAAKPEKPGNCLDTILQDNKNKINQGDLEFKILKAIYNAKEHIELGIANNSLKKVMEYSFPNILELNSLIRSSGKNREAYKEKINNLDLKKLESSVQLYEYLRDNPMLLAYAFGTEDTKNRMGQHIVNRPAAGKSLYHTEEKNGPEFSPESGRMISSASIRDICKDMFQRGNAQMSLR